MFTGWVVYARHKSSKMEFITFTVKCETAEEAIVTIMRKRFAFGQGNEWVLRAERVTILGEGSMEKTYPSLPERIAKSAGR